MTVVAIQAKASVEKKGHSYFCRREKIEKTGVIEDEK
jgi:hypothetical protein